MKSLTAFQFPLLLRSVFMMSLVFKARLLAQETRPGSEPTRLEQLDAIYQQQLRTLHVPLLSKYLMELQQQAARASDPAPYRAEIARVQQWIAGGGTVDVVAAARELAEGTTPVAPAPATSTRIEGAGSTQLLSLTPAFARSISPVPDGSASPISAAVGRMSWRMDSLAAGHYQVVLHFAPLPSLTSPTEVVLDFAGQRLSAKISPETGGKNPRQFRLLRLGQLTLDKAVDGAELSLTVGDAESSALLVRHLHLTRLPAAAR
jgi:hypothetical protein